MIKCFECQGKVSSTARACPSCGADLRSGRAFRYYYDWVTRPLGGRCGHCEGGKCSTCAGTGRTTKTVKGWFTSKQGVEHCVVCRGTGICQWCKGDGQMRLVAYTIAGDPSYDTADSWDGHEVLDYGSDLWRAMAELDLYYSLLARNLEALKNKPGDGYIRL